MALIETDSRLAHDSSTRRFRVRFGSNGQQPDARLVCVGVALGNQKLLTIGGPIVSIRVDFAERGDRILRAAFAGPND